MVGFNVALSKTVEAFEVRQQRYIVELSHALRAQWTSIFQHLSRCKSWRRLLHLRWANINHALDFHLSRLLVVKKKNRFVAALEHWKDKCFLGMVRSCSSPGLCGGLCHSENIDAKIRWRVHTGKWQRSSSSRAHSEPSNKVYTLLVYDFADVDETARAIVIDVWLRKEQWHFPP